MEYGELAGKRLLILGAYASEIEIVEAAKSLGVYTIVTDNHVDWNDAPAKYAADEAWDISWSDYDALQRQCEKSHVDGVFAGFSERRVACAQELAGRLGFPFYADGSDLPVIQNKNSFREACIAVGVDVPRSYSIDDAEYPVIVKPADNGGCKGITICYSAEELNAARAKAVGSSDSSDIVIDEYVVADEIMVYYVVHNGQVTLSAMGDRYMRSFDPAVAQLPVGFRFPSKYLEMFEEHHDERYRNLIRSLGIRNGLIAFQCLVKDGRVMPFDPTYRLDGSRTFHATEEVNGANVLKMLIRHSLTGTMGDDEEIAATENPHFGRLVFQLVVLLGKGTVCDIVGLDEVEAMEGVYFVERKAKVGDVMPDPVGFPQMLTRLQFVVDDDSQLLPMLQKILGMIDVINENGESMVLFRDAEALASGIVKRCDWL